MFVIVTLGFMFIPLTLLVRPQEKLHERVETCCASPKSFFLGTSLM